ncbi:hypothetical protein, partial [Nostoc sp. FACHB-190]|uniref:hypothetical protein n=1 Tax=Nostoc sp. FACHB-190 TaxID=2692838 RepID=UPI00168278B4
MKKIAITTLALTGLVLIKPTAAQAFELTPTQKLQLVATQAPSQDLFFLSGFLDGETKNQGIQTGFLNSSSFSLNLQGTIRDIDYTTNYLGTFDSNSCSELQTSRAKTANKAILKPHYLQIRFCSKRHYLQMKL